MVLFLTESLFLFLVPKSTPRILIYKFGLAYIKHWSKGFAWKRISCLSDTTWLLSVSFGLSLNLVLTRLLLGLYWSWSFLELASSGLGCSSTRHTLWDPKKIYNSSITACEIMCILQWKILWWRSSDPVSSVRMIWKSACEKNGKLGRCQSSTNVYVSFLPFAFVAALWVSHHPVLYSYWSGLHEWCSFRFYWKMFTLAERCHRVPLVIVK